MKPSMYEFSHKSDTFVVLDTYQQQSFEWENGAIRLMMRNGGNSPQGKSSKKDGKKNKKKKQQRLEANGASGPIISNNPGLSDEVLATNDTSLAEEEPAETAINGLQIDEASARGPAESHASETPLGESNSGVGNVLGERYDGTNRGDQPAGPSTGDRDVHCGFVPRTTGLIFGSASEHARGQVRYQMLASSHHLIEASPVLRKMLNGPFTEAGTDGQGFHWVNAEGWDLEALVIVLDIIHGHNRSVPRSPTLEVVAKVAVIVDYYDCLETVEIFAEIWLKWLEDSQPKAYGRDSMLWLFMSWTFLRRDIFAKMATFALRYSEGPIKAENIQIPDTILSRINKEREKALDKIFSKLYGLLDALCMESECSEECSSMLLGTLMKGLSRRGIFKKHIEKPFRGHSIVSAKTMVEGFVAPKCYRYLNHSRIEPFGSYNSIQSCSIAAKMRPTLDEVERELPSLKLEDFLSRVNRGLSFGPEAESREGFSW